MKTNLGQSKFQDTFFVAGSQLTPYRQLRQLDLELRSLEDSLKRADINHRRTQLKISKLDASIPEQALDIEEFEWDLSQQAQLIEDSIVRRDNFLELRKQLLTQVPQEYWDQGFEQAEAEHWVQHVTNELVICKQLGIPSRTAVEQFMQLPPAAQEKVILAVPRKINEAIAFEQQVFEAAGLLTQDKPQLQVS